MVETEADYFGNCPVCGALLDTGDLGLMLAHVHDAEITKARSRRRAKLVAVGSQNKPAGVNRRAMCGRKASQPTRRFSADVLPRFSISS